MHTYTHTHTFRCQVCKIKKNNIRRSARVISRKTEKFVFPTALRDKRVCVSHLQQHAVSRNRHNLRRHYKTPHKDKFGVLQLQL